MRQLLSKSCKIKDFHPSFLDRAVWNTLCCSKTEQYEEFKKSIEEHTMAIQKKSLISSLNTTKRAIVASSTPAENPSVSSPVKTQVSRQIKNQIKSQIKSAVKSQIKSQIKSAVKSQVMY